MRSRMVIPITLIILLSVSSLARAQSGNGYDLTWHTIDSGGVTFSMGNGYQLGGTIGQPDAGSLSGGNYTLSGGFWQSGESSEPSAHCVYLPLVLR
ncbi:MAG: hypothetical protein JXR84_09365 [Anaerolineae bacterium]|nr:hypothetical protein [Anaerolineae bacterium]